jgi:hypothetical protein
MDFYNYRESNNLTPQNPIFFFFTDKPPDN